MSAIIAPLSNKTLALVKVKKFSDSNENIKTITKKTANIPAS
jgi:hypothetical protein